MKKIPGIYSSLLFLAILLLASPLAQAQGPGGHGHHGKQLNKAEHQAKMQQELGLTDQQAAQMEAIHAKYEPQFEALKSGEGEMDREKMRELHKSMRAEVQQVLTEEQQAKMKEMRHELHEGRRGHPGMHGEGHHRGGHGDFGHRKGGNKEVKAYMKKNITPVLKAQRAKLDTKMSAEDKTTVESLRGELKAMRAENNGFKGEKREMKKEGERPTEAQRAEMKAFREKRHVIMEEASAIALKYQRELEALHQEIMPQAEKWHADMQEIMEKHRAEKAEKGQKGEWKGKGHCEGKTEGADCKARCEGKRKGYGHGHHKGDPMQRKLDAAHFILMDPTKGNFKAATSAETPSSNAKLDIYPNPTANQNTISYEVKQAGKVTIEMLDAKGQVVRQVLSGTREAGSFTQDVDVSSLSSGVYFYRITDASGSRSKNFSIAK